VVTHQGSSYWYLATHLEDPLQAVWVYEHRVWVEEGFRDDKSLLKAVRYRVKADDRLERLLLGLVGACLILARIGAEVARTSSLRRLLVHKKGPVGVIWLAINLLCFPHLIPAGLIQQALGAPLLITLPAPSETKSG